jgi:hypothetical protein
MAADGFTNGFKALSIWSPAVSIPVKRPLRRLGASRARLGTI